MPKVTSQFAVMIMTIIFSTPTYSATEGSRDNRVCIAAIASVMNRDPSTMTTQRTAEGIVLVSYRRPDGDSFTYKCRVEGSRVLWGNPDGRWRDHPMDSKVTYRESGDTVSITETWPDGSTTTKDIEVPVSE